MKTLRIKDFGPIAQAAVELNKITILFGPHGAGKSTVANALALLSFGESPKIKLRKSMYQLVRAGAERAILVLSGDGTERKVTISGASIRGQKASATSLDNLQFSPPWEALDQKPSVWRDLLGDSKIPKDKLTEALRACGLSEATISSLSFELGQSDLQSIISSLESRRTSLYQEATALTKAPPSPVLTVCEKSIDITAYLPHKEAYKERANNCFKVYKSSTDAWNAAIVALGRWEGDLREANRIIEENRDLLSIDNKQLTDTIARYRKDIEDFTREMPAETVCPTCLQKLPVQVDPTTANQVFVLEAKIKAAEESILRKEQLEKALENRENLEKNKPAGPNKEEWDKKRAEMAGLNGLLQAIDTYEKQLQAAKDGAKLADEKLALRQQVQIAIECLRSPEMIERLGAADLVKVVRERLAKNTEILGIPAVSLREDLSLQVWMPDGSFRDSSLLSDTQKALAGLAVIEAVSYAKKSPLLIVDQADWVHGEAVKKLAEFITAAAQDRECTLVMTASPDLFGAVPSYRRPEVSAYDLSKGVITKRN